MGKFLILLVLPLFVVQSATAAEGHGERARRSRRLDGIYEGMMHLSHDGRALEVPLQLSLTVTSEIRLVQIGPNKYDAQRVIEGSVLVDDEGGPYPLTRIGYNLDKSQIDMRANREELTLASAPAAFRLVGKVGENGGIRGRVISGMKGTLGAFEVERVERSVLQPRLKYQGYWEGIANIGGGYQIPFAIGVGSILASRANPLSLEFDYTPGKLGFMTWRTTRMNFNAIYIDYLTRTMYLTDAGNPIGAGVTSNAECTVDFDHGEIVGTLYNVRGIRARYRLKRWEPQSQARPKKKAGAQSGGK